MQNTFVLSDEAVNSYGFVVLTKGIDVERFKKNPIMLYNHNRDAGIIGRWDNIRIDKNKLLADAVFDEKNATGSEVKRKVEEGFLRAVSIGATPIEKNVINGIETIVKSILTEVSIVDIPSNQNAVKLSKNRQNLHFIKLGKSVTPKSKSNNDLKNELKTKIIDLLKLKTDVTDEEILESITLLIENSQNIENEINNATETGLINISEKDILLKYSRLDSKYCLSFLQQKRNEQNDKNEELIEKALFKGKLIASEKDIFLNIGNNMGHTVLKQVLSVLPEAVKPNDFIAGGKAFKKETWGIKEYRKYAPAELSKNKKLYENLLNKERKEKEEKTEVYDLNWYRKNNPEALQNDPELYKNLLNKSNK